MNKGLTARIIRLLQRRHLKGMLAKIALALSCMSIFMITYMLVAPVLTQEWETVCGVEEHTHDEDCYGDMLVCGLDAAGAAGHEHSDGCYELRSEDVLACGQEVGGHIHSESCYAGGETTLTCTRPTGGHTHTDACYTVETVAKYKTVTEDITETVTVEDTETRDITDEDGNVTGTETVVTGSHEETRVVGTREVQVEDGTEEVRTLTCTEEESQGHEHDESCYTTTERTLVCAEEEAGGHQHDDSCYEQREEKVLVCTGEEPQGHEHSSSCFESGPICGLEEHTHTDQCYHVPGEGGPQYTCGFLTEHTHGEGCYFESGELKCTITEHLHDDRCLSAHRFNKIDESVFPEELPEGYEEVDIFQFGGMMFAMSNEEESGEPGLSALVYVPGNAFEEDVMFVPWPLFEDDDAYAAAAETLAEAGVEYDSMTAMDLSFMNEDGEMLEPNTEDGPVYVRLTMPMELPEKGKELTLWHHTGEAAEEVEAYFVYEDGTLTVDFAADSFSPYMVTVSEFEDGASSLVSWGPVSPSVEPVMDSGVTTWDVSSTPYRYLEIPIRINISGKMTIQLPYVLEGVGRTPDHDPKLEIDGIKSDAIWTPIVDEANNTVTIETNDNSHGTLDVYYSFDCWNVVSNKPFGVSYSISSATSQPQSAKVTGKIKTGYGVTIEEYNNDVGNSNYAFDGFGGADKPAAFIPKWNFVYGTYFGLEKKDFDGDNYVYDLAAFLVKPTGQQPYDINGTFTPGKGGTLVGAVYMMDSSKRPDDLYVTFLKNAQPGANGGYSFTIANESLNEAVVSSNLTDQTDNKVYTLYFLVKYSKNEIDKELDKDNKVRITLAAELSLTHKGIDSGKETDVTSREVYLYKDIPNDMGGLLYPADRVYWASYVVSGATGVVKSATGLTALNKGYTAALDFSADFFCLNENRSNFQEGTNEAQLNKYRLEAIIDLSYQTSPDKTQAYQSGSEKQLDVGDYQFSSYKLNLVDAAGAWSHNSHGVPNVGWKQDKFGNAPAWAASEKIVVYGSKTLTGNDWTKLGEVSASEVWAIDKDRAFKNECEWQIKEPGIVRLKVVYNSRLTTALRVGYQMTLKPDGPSKFRGVTSDKLYLTNWFDYLGYTPSGARDPAMAFSRYPVSDEGGWGEENVGTLESARKHDKAHPYPGYPQPAKWDSETEYSLRNFAKAELGTSNDVAGMIVTQALYDSNEVIIGDPVSLSPDNTYSRKKEVVNVSEVVYTISGVVTNGASSSPDLQARRGQADESSAYRAVKQRYYVLLPEKMKLNMFPENNYGSSAEYWYLSPYSAFYHGGSPKVVKGGDTAVPVSDGRVDGWKSNSWANVSEMYWAADGTVELGDYQGQLVVFEREIDLDDTSYLSARYNMWESPVYFWGRGLSFSIVPRAGIGSLPAGEYETKFWCQYLDGNGNPIPMTDFVTNPDKGSEEDLELLRESTGGVLDPDTLLYIPIDFKNSSGASGSEGEIAVGKIDGNVWDHGDEIDVRLEQAYYYELSYQVTSGTTQNVVLWCDLEGYDRDVTSEWKGTMTGVDLNGRNDVTVYVSTEGFSTKEYIQKGVNKDWLDPAHGWTAVREADLEHYDWSKVKAVAFAFSSTFEEGGKGSLPPSVYIEMAAPKDEDVEKVRGKSEYTAYNEYIFSDEHLTQEGKYENGYALVMRTAVTLKLTYELPSTGGAGTDPLYAAGMALILTAVSLMYLNLRRGRKAREGGRA